MLKKDGVNGKGLIREGAIIYYILYITPFFIYFCGPMVPCRVVNNSTSLIEFRLMMPTGKHSNAARASGKKGGTNHLNDGDQGQRPSFYLFFPTVHLIMKMLK